MTSFLDLALIMVGATALVAQVNLRQVESAAFAGDETNARQFHFALEELFAPDDARLSPGGQQEMAELAPRLGDDNVRVHVPAEQAGSSSGRLNGWEMASARMASILHALHRHGIAEEKLETAAIKVTRSEAIMDEEDETVTISSFPNRNK
ncbi:MAG: hypothetical protein AAFX04_10460 [Pseudomonadota bacterium]